MQENASKCRLPIDGRFIAVSWGYPLDQNVASLDLFVYAKHIAKSITTLQSCQLFTVTQESNIFHAYMYKNAT